MGRRIDERGAAIRTEMSFRFEIVDQCFDGMGIRPDKVETRLHAVASRSSSGGCGNG